MTDIGCGLLPIVISTAAAAGKKMKNRRNP